MKRWMCIALPSLFVIVAALSWIYGKLNAVDSAMLGILAMCVLLIWIHVPKLAKLDRLKVIEETYGEGWYKDPRYRVAALCELLDAYANVPTLRDCNEFAYSDQQQKTWKINDVLLALTLPADPEGNNYLLKVTRFRELRDGLEHRNSVAQIDAKQMTIFVEILDRHIGSQYNAPQPIAG